MYLLRIIYTLFAKKGVKKVRLRKKGSDFRLRKKGSNSFPPRGRAGARALIFTLAKIISRRMLRKRERNLLNSEIGYFYTRCATTLFPACLQQILSNIQMVCRKNMKGAAKTDLQKKAVKTKAVAAQKNAASSPATTSQSSRILSPKRGARSVGSAC